VDEGKAREDLLASGSATHSPLWAHFHGRVDATPGESKELTLILLGGPIFLSCITDPPNEVTDVLGPIEVVMPAPK
jgi:hypothetical protein